MTEQSNLVSGAVGRYCYRSWEDQGRPDLLVFQGHPASIVVVAAWWNSRGHSTRGHQNGQTFRDEWAWARAIGPRFAIAGTFNEWRRGEQPGADVSKDIESSTEFGEQYSKVLKLEAARFKAGR